ncbi:aminotransferase class V-fold PLP-dependent enzyme [Streptomyces sp. NBC_01433]|uniref:aminotransferase class V-fold PLP-dependent enzyme n=1 Tax=Streptomyces sp. NBC_01433 TaxID=2903864 RepID=UPI00224CA7C4|nr:aminotransferase class V-fold PLP-dependent enzyme [Streptomyces sp. NBC_01433]MCX4679955.1 aminotransferase class V-fold PLP-dependent enzyme [Streptomyces sp. NBC_01433]
MTTFSGGRHLPCARHLFDIPDAVAYFNTASLAPTLRTGLSAGEASLRNRAQPWKITSEDWFTAAERRRELFADVIGARADDIALISATSYGIATAAQNLTASPGQRVLVLADEYPSGIYTWWRFTERTGASMLTVQRRPGQSWTEAVLDVLDETVAVVSVPQVHWTDGSLLDLDAIAQAARAAGAALVIDASQSAGAMPLDMNTLRPDFLVTVGYKWLLGPFGLGYLYIAPAHHNGPPLEENWIVRQGAQDFARLVDYRQDYQPGARRFDMGQRTAFELTPMAIAALEQITTWTVPSIAATLSTTTGRIAAAAQERGLIVPDPSGPHIVGINVPSGTRQQLLATLADADIHVGARGAALRISPHLHTTEQDINRLVAALDSAVSRA